MALLGARPSVSFLALRGRPLLLSQVVGQTLALILCVLPQSGVWHGKDNGILEVIVGVVVARHHLEQGQLGDLHGQAH